LGENFGNTQVVSQIVNDNGWAFGSHTSHKQSLDNGCQADEIAITLLMQLFPPELLKIFFGKIAKDSEAAQTMLKESDKKLNLAKVERIAQLFYASHPVRYKTYGLIQVVNQTPGDATLDVKIAQCWIHIKVDKFRVLFLRFQNGCNTLSVDINQLLIPADKL
jgi:hypothetical protein